MPDLDTMLTCYDLDTANDPDKVDADAEFNKYEASAIVTLAGKGIMYVNHPWYKLLWYGYRDFAHLNITDILPPLITG